MRGILIGFPLSLLLWWLILPRALRLAPDPKPAGVWGEHLP